MSEQCRRNSSLIWQQHGPTTSALLHRAERAVEVFQPAVTAYHIVEVELAAFVQIDDIALIECADGIDQVMALDRRSPLITK